MINQVSLKHYSSALKDGGNPAGHNSYIAPGIVCLYTETTLSVLDSHLYMKEEIYSFFKNVDTDYRIQTVTSFQYDKESAQYDATADHNYVLCILKSMSHSESLICLFNFTDNKLEKCIAIPGEITSVEFISRLSYGDGDEIFDGCVILGFKRGLVYFLNLCMTDSRISNEFSPRKSVSVKKNVLFSVGTDFNSMERKHSLICLDDSVLSWNSFLYMKTNKEIWNTIVADDVKVTCLKYISLANALIVGYNFGCIQFVNLHELQLEYCMRYVASRGPVVKIDYQEPENDPRYFIYIWVGRNALSGDSPSLASISMLQFGFRERELTPNGHLYKNISSAAECLISPLPPKFENNSILLNGSADYSSKLLSMRTLILTRHASGEESNATSDLCRTAFVWKENCKLRLGIFDLNRWYHAQMPRKFSVNESDVCSYFSTYLLSEDLQCGVPYDVEIDDKSVRLYNGTTEKPLPEPFLYPTALNFRCKCYFSNGVYMASILSYQESLLQHLRLGRVYSSVDHLHQLCHQSGLITSLQHSNTTGSNHLATTSHANRPQLAISSQLNDLLNVLLEHKCNTLLFKWLEAVTIQSVVKLRSVQSVTSLTAFVDQAAKVELDVALKWLWNKFLTCKDKIDSTLSTLYTGQFEDISRSDVVDCKRLLSVCSILGQLFSHCPDLIDKNQEFVNPDTSAMRDRIHVQVNIIRLFNHGVKLALWFHSSGVLTWCDSNAFNQMQFALQQLKGKYSHLRRRAIDAQSSPLIDQLFAELHPNVKRMWFRAMLDMNEEEDFSTSESDATAVEMSPVYPPVSLQLVVCVMMSPHLKMNEKVAILLYFLHDMSKECSNCQDSSNENCSIEKLASSFCYAFNVSNSIAKTVQFCWLIDNDDKEMLLSCLPLHQDHKLEELYVGQHWAIISHLYKLSQFTNEEIYLRCARRCIDCLSPRLDCNDQEQLQTYICIFLDCAEDDKALKLINQYNMDEALRESLIDLIIQKSYSNGRIHYLLRSPRLRHLEQDFFDGLLRANKGEQVVLQHILRGEFNEASTVDQKVAHSRVPGGGIVHQIVSGIVNALPTVERDHFIASTAKKCVPDISIRSCPIKRQNSDVQTFFTVLPTKRRALNSSISNFDISVVSNEHYSEYQTLYSILEPSHILLPVRGAHCDQMTESLPEDSLEEGTSPPLVNQKIGPVGILKSPFPGAATIPSVSSNSKLSVEWKSDLLSTSPAPAKPILEFNREKPVEQEEEQNSSAEEEFEETFSFSKPENHPAADQTVVDDSFPHQHEEDFLFTNPISKSFHTERKNIPDNEETHDGESDAPNPSKMAKVAISSMIATPDQPGEANNSLQWHSVVSDNFPPFAFQFSELPISQSQNENLRESEGEFVFSNPQLKISDNSTKPEEVESILIEEDTRFFSFSSPQLSRESKNMKVEITTFPTSSCNLGQQLQIHKINDEPGASYVNRGSHSSTSYTPSFAFAMKFLTEPSNSKSLIEKSEDQKSIKYDQDRVKDSKRSKLLSDEEQDSFSFSFPKKSISSSSDRIISDSVSLLENPSFTFAKPTQSNYIADLSCEESVGSPLISSTPYVEQEETTNRKENCADEAPFMSLKIFHQCSSDMFKSAILNQGSHSKMSYVKPCTAYSLFSKSETLSTQSPKLKFPSVEQSKESECDKESSSTSIQSSKEDLKNETAQSSSTEKISDDTKQEEESTDREEEHRPPSPQKIDSMLMNQGSLAKLSERSPRESIPCEGSTLLTESSQMGKSIMETDTQSDCSMPANKESQVKPPRDISVEKFLVENSVRSSIEEDSIPPLITELSNRSESDLSGAIHFSASCEDKNLVEEISEDSQPNPDAIQSLENESEDKIVSVSSLEESKTDTTPQPQYPDCIPDLVASIKKKSAQPLIHESSTSQIDEPPSKESAKDSKPNPDAIHQSENVPEDAIQTLEKESEDSTVEDKVVSTSISPEEPAIDVPDSNENNRASSPQKSPKKAQVVCSNPESDIDINKVKNSPVRRTAASQDKRPLWSSLESESCSALSIDTSQANPQDDNQSNVSLSSPALSTSSLRQTKARQKSSVKQQKRDTSESENDSPVRGVSTRSTKSSLSSPNKNISDIEDSTSNQSASSKTTPLKSTRRSKLSQKSNRGRESMTGITPVKSKNTAKKSKEKKNAETPSKSKGRKSSQSNSASSSPQNSQSSRTGKRLSSTRIRTRSSHSLSKSADDISDISSIESSPGKEPKKTRGRKKKSDDQLKKSQPEPQIALSPIAEEFPSQSQTVTKSKQSPKKSPVKTGGVRQKNLLARESSDESDIQSTQTTPDKDIPLTSKNVTRHQRRRKTSECLSTAPTTPEVDTASAKQPTRRRRTGQQRDTGQSSSEEVVTVRKRRTGRSTSVSKGEPNKELLNISDSQSVDTLATDDDDAGSIVDSEIDIQEQNPRTRQKKRLLPTDESTPTKRQRKNLRSRK